MSFTQASHFAISFSSTRTKQRRYNVMMSFYIDNDVILDDNDDVIHVDISAFEVIQASNVEFEHPGSISLHTIWTSA